jgi:hypothetical protein
VLIRPRPRTLRRRLGEFVSVSLGDARKTARATDLVLARAEETVADKHWWGRFRDELELAGRSKDSYAARQDFLDRSEMRREDDARRARMAGRA